MRRWLAPACFFFVLSPSAVAFADGDCPPGSWFCEEADVKPPPQAQDDKADASDETAQTPQDAPSSKKHKKAHKAPPAAPAAAADGAVELHTSGPVVIYTQGEGRAIPPPPPPPKPKKKRVWRERFGLNLRGEGAAFKAANGGVNGMGGVGISFRYRPAPAFALDFGGDIMGGKDYYDQTRVESAFSTTAMVYFNPRSILQLYGLLGFNLTHAEIVSQQYTAYDRTGYSTYEVSNSHDYFGGHAGLGLEFRLARHVALDVDGIGLIRHRIDDNGGPEFRDPKTGNTTDTSAAGVFRGGITFWW